MLPNTIMIADWESWERDGTIMISNEMDLDMIYLNNLTDAVQREPLN